MKSAQDLIAAARFFIDVPYVHQGHSSFGMDCIGFVFTAALLADVDIEALMSDQNPSEPVPLWNYSRTAQAEGIARTQKWLKQIPSPIPGCLIFFKFPQEAHPSHFAIYTGTSIIHALAIERKVVEQTYGRPWVQWAHSFWELPGIEYV